MIADPTTTGTKVLCALAEGRDQLNARKRAAAAELDRRVRRAIDLDALGDHPVRGRAGRIAARLKVPRRTVARAMHRLGLTDRCGQFTE